MGFGASFGWYFKGRPAENQKEGTFFFSAAPAGKSGLPALLLRCGLDRTELQTSKAAKKSTKLCRNHPSNDLGLAGPQNDRVIVQHFSCSRLYT